MSKIQELQESMNKIQQFSGEFDKFMQKSFLIEGKTIREWNKHFFITVPDDVTFPIIVNLAAKIMKNHQEAAFYRDKRNIQFTILEQDRGEKHTEAYNKARREHEEKFGKGLAAPSCQAAADEAIKDLDVMIFSQKVARDFWNKTCERLVEMRKLVELMGRALAGDTWTNREITVKSREY